MVSDPDSYDFLNRDMAYKDYTDDDIRRIAPNVTNMAQLLRELKLRVAGGNFVNMKRKLQKLDVDCDHWTGCAWSKNQRLKDWSDYARPAALKPHLIALRGHYCEECHLSQWQGKLIPLEVHHISNDRTNNDESNLRLMCCNCHAQTDAWRGKRNKLQ